MREIDRRTRVSRRVFLHGAATAGPAAALAAAGMGISAQAAWAQGVKALAPATMATLVRMARDIYPHDQIADSYYVKAAAPWDEKAASEPALKSMLEAGVAALDTDAKARFGAPYLGVADEADRLILLRAIEHGAFFQKLRSDLVVSLYNQHDLWARFGYEGASAQFGGYLHRGFDDINWVTKA